MKKVQTLFFLIIVLLETYFLSGCATAPKFSPVTSIEQDKSLIYLYVKDPSPFSMSAGRIRVWANQEHVADIGFNGYFPYITDPGEKEFAYMIKVDALTFGPAAILQKKKIFSKFYAEKNKTYYLKWDCFKEKIGVLMDEESALKELVKYKLKSEPGGAKKDQW